MEVGGGVHFHVPRIAHVPRTAQEFGAMEISRRPEDRRRAWCLVGGE